MLKLSVQVLTTILSLVGGVLASAGTLVMAEQLLLVNPRKRKTTRRRSPRTTARRRSYRRNPIGGLNLRGIMKVAKAGAVGAGGAIAADLAMQRLPIPAMLSTSRFLPAVRGLVGIGLGWAVGKFLKQRQLGEELAVGAVSVAAYGVARNMMSGGVVVENDVSGYGDLLGMEDGLLGLDYFNPAAVEANPFSGNDLAYQQSSDSDFF